MDTPGSGAVLAVMTLVGIRGVFSAIWGTCWASWMRDLVPQQVIGSYYSRRLAAALGAVAVISLAASFFVRWWTDSAAPENALYAYSFIIIGGALTLGIASPSFVLGARGTSHAACTRLRQTTTQHPVRTPQGQELLPASAGFSSSGVSHPTWLSPSLRCTCSQS